ncbi:PilN domain-containing protein [Rubrivivax rivuli]|nr:PilN domain-containing protein [Rubrivivax rivuli]
MPHQVNLYSPILLAPRRHFSAAAMARALAVLVLGVGALCAWLMLRSEQQRAELQASEAFTRTESQRLNTLLAGRRVLPQDGAALQQELAREEALLAQARLEHEAAQRGRVREGRSPAALLQLLARTVPAPVWLSSVHIDDGALRFSGHTLQPEALRPWLAQLGAHPLTAPQQLGVARVEKQAAAPAGSGAAAGAERWQFSVTPAQGTSAEPARTEGRP